MIAMDENGNRRRTMGPQNLRWTGGPVLALLAAFSLAAVADDRPLTWEERGEAFLKHLESSGTDPAQLEEIRAEWTRAKEEAPGADFVGESMIRIWPEYREALHQFQQDYPLKAAETLTSALSGTTDPYRLAAGSYYKARCLLKLDEFEGALPLLEKVAGELAPYSQVEAEAAFYLAATRAQALDREGAIAALEAFLAKYVNAPERYRIVAEQLRDDLKYRGENELLDLSDRMKSVERLLDKAKSGEPTQEKQKEIVEILDKLIKKHEQDCAT